MGNSAPQASSLPAFQQTQSAPPSPPTHTQEQQKPQFIPSKTDFLEGPKGVRVATAPFKMYSFDPQVDPVIEGAQIKTWRKYCDDRAQELLDCLWDKGIDNSEANCKDNWTAYRTCADEVYNYHLDSEFSQVYEPIEEPIETRVAVAWRKRLYESGPVLNDRVLEREVKAGRLKRSGFDVS